MGELTGAPVPYAGGDIDQGSGIEAAPVPYMDSAVQELRMAMNRFEGMSLKSLYGGGAERAGGLGFGTAGTPERVIGADERIQIIPMTSQPYRWICHIRIRTGSNSYVGSGFLINIPWSTTGCILTAGHNLWMTNRKYADSLEITSPERTPLQFQSPTLLRAVRNITSRLNTSRALIATSIMARSCSPVIREGDSGTARSSRMMRYARLRQRSLATQEINRAGRCGEQGASSLNRP